MTPCWKGHGRWFISYLNDITKIFDLQNTVLDLNLRLASKFLFFVTLSIQHVETCVIPQGYDPDH